MMAVDGDESLELSPSRRTPSLPYGNFSVHTAMKIYWILALLTTGASSVSVVLNHPTSLSCGCGEKVMWRKTFPLKVIVAECQKEECVVTQSFKEKLSVMHEKNYSLFIKSAKYNDLGQYECICDGFINKVNLEVLVAINVTAVELGTITLQCYADTQSGVNDVTWLHNEQTVLHYTVNGATKTGNGSEDRVSLTDDGFRHGDVSLTITGVQKRDAGLYRCFVHDENINGYPHAYMLHVNEVVTGAGGGDQTEDSNNEKRTRIGLIVSFSLFICFSLFVCFLLVILYRKKMARFFLRSVTDGVWVRLACLVGDTSFPAISPT